jgi:hypothetical protein
MSIGPELVGKKFPSKSGIRPMPRERFASRVLWQKVNGKHSKKVGPQ